MSRTTVSRTPRSFDSRAWRWGTILAILLSGCAPALHPLDEPEDMTSSPASPAEVDGLLESAEAAYRIRTVESVSRTAELALQAAALDRRRTEGLILAARARIWLADHLDDPDRRDAEAVDAVKTAQRCRERDGEDVDCAYWLALAVGVQARERRSTGVAGVNLMVDLLSEVAHRAPGMDHAGPHRVLALVYLRAPGWPTGPGDRDAGLEQALKAVELAPDYPPNHLCLGEALEAVGRTEASREAYRRARESARAWLERGDPDAAGWLEQAEGRDLD